MNCCPLPFLPLHCPFPFPSHSLYFPSAASGCSECKTHEAAGELLPLLRVHKETVTGRKGRQALKYKSLREGKERGVNRFLSCCKPGVWPPVRSALVTKPSPHRARSCLQAHNSTTRTLQPEPQPRALHPLGPSTWAALRTVLGTDTIGTGKGSLWARLQETSPGLGSGTKALLFSPTQ